MPGLLSRGKQFGSELSAARNVGLAELGLRGSLRLAQTVRRVYPKALRWLLQWRQPTPLELRELFESLGATYIKFGQFIASSPSVFPKEYVDEFQKCLDQTPAIPFTRIRQTIEQDLGCPIDQVFAHIDPEALASASIAQVHAATLLSGEDVVVKVQKPGVQAVLTTDLNAVYLLTRLFELIMPHTDRDAIAGLVAEMYQSMIDECDFRKEANNLREFRQFLAATGNTQVIAPKPYEKASGDRVLTMERLYGKALTDTAPTAGGVNATESLFNALNTWFASLTQCPFFHADLHSGNLMLLPDGRVGFIDFGMVGRIQPEAWQAMFALFSGIGNEDYRQMAEAMVKVGITRDKVDVDRLTVDITALFRGLNAMDPADVLEGRGTDGINTMLSDLGSIARDYGIRFPRSFTMLLKQFLYFDRYVEMLAPGADIFHDERIDLMLP